MTTGLVLSGGMAKGAYQIGALRAISNYIRPQEIQYVSASSIGVLNAFAFASGQLAKAEKYWRDLPGDAKKILITSLFHNGSLKNEIAEFTAAPLFSRCFYVTLFQMQGKTNHYIDLVKINRESIKEYLYASIAFIPLVKSVCIDENRYCDGAIIDNIPFYPLIRHSPDLILCFYFDDEPYMFGTDDFDRKVVKIVLDDDRHLLSDSIWFSKEKTEKMIQIGYEKTDFLLKRILGNGTGDLETLYDRIRTVNQAENRKTLRITGDVIINNLNKITKRLVRREIR